jgi:hypothetical protein
LPAHEQLVVTRFSGMTFSYNLLSNPLKRVTTNRAWEGDYS